MTEVFLGLSLQRAVLGGCVPPLVSDGGGKARSLAKQHSVFSRLKSH